MTIKAKIIALTGGALFLTAIAIGFFSVVQIKNTGNMSIAQIEEMGRHEVDRIRNEGKKEIEVFRSDLMQRKKEYLKSQVQTALGVLEKGNKDAYDPIKIQDLYKARLQNTLNTLYSMVVNIEKLDINGLQGDDKFFVESTAPGVVTTLIGDNGSRKFHMRCDLPQHFPYFID